ncbi:5'-methylthioadenosine/adenosylhomocysteine nucleosidase [Helicobacter marmotae]|uniref:adenosylhomocysteine nucleosidase n=1 Tax=Helicobacter marmotae TaxID=152490 RepID=A0A3D8I579_9HELI|nr:5'-methylthioadenosine/adenosylhomocysteine nucleosidase [Helicobacter marmotae]RDU60277.1 5'-methylthioadenosine/adenosylhomocysteine nucleosidase [Helicobacter marmotae]
MVIGIIGAMVEEITPLLAHFGHYKEHHKGGNVYYEIAQGEHRIFIAYSKIGKVHAALSAGAMILSFGCEQIIFSGVAGALSAELKVGDLVLGLKLCQHDVDISAFGHALGFIPESKLYVESSPALNAIAREVANSQAIPLKEGIIASGDCFIANGEKKQWIARQFNAIAVEMEGAAVAVVCDACGIPFCILRSISDNADGSADISFDEFLESSAKRSADFVVQMCAKILQ